MKIQSTTSLVGFAGMLWLCIDNALHEPILYLLSSNAFPQVFDGLPSGARNPNTTQALELAHALQRVRSSHRRRDAGGGDEDERRQGRRTRRTHRNAHGERRSRSSGGEGEGEGWAGGGRGQKREGRDGGENKDEKEEEEGQEFLGRRGDDRLREKPSGLSG